jgi:hypothetical protein
MKVTQEQLRRLVREVVGSRLAEAPTGVPITDMVEDAKKVYDAAARLMKAVKSGDHEQAQLACSQVQAATAALTRTSRGAPRR